jgi:Icc-related predicted phosphoesterase
MPRILAFTDIHGSAKAAEAVVKLSRRSRPDLVISAGDVTVFGVGYDEALHTLSHLKRQVFWVPGNHEEADITLEIGQAYPFFLDLSCSQIPVEHHGLSLVGLSELDGIGTGGGEKNNWLDAALDLWCTTKSRRVFVIVTHYPPSGTRCDGTLHPVKASGPYGPSPDAGGSRLVRQVVERLEPALVVCGHYHSASGQIDHIGNTLVVNPGPKGMLVDISRGRAMVVKG